MTGPTDYQMEHITDRLAEYRMEADRHLMGEYLMDGGHLSSLRTGVFLKEHQTG